MSQKPFMDPPEQESIPGTPPPPRRYEYLTDAAKDHLPSQKQVKWRFTMWYDIDPDELRECETQDGEDIMYALRQYGDVTIVKVEEIDA